MLLAFQRTQIWSPIPVLDGKHMLAIPALGDMAPSSGICRQLHLRTYACINTHAPKEKKIEFILVTFATLFYSGIFYIKTFHQGEINLNEKGLSAASYVS